jgi:hypothetical protein
MAAGYTTVAAEAIIRVNLKQRPILRQSRRHGWGWEKLG